MEGKASGKGALAARRLKCSHEFFSEKIRAQGCYEAGTLQFMEKIMHNSGVGGEAYMPPGGAPALKNSKITETEYMPGLDTAQKSNLVIVIALRMRSSPKLGSVHLRLLRYILRASPGSRPLVNVSSS